MKRACVLLSGYVRYAFLRWFFARSFAFTLVVNQAVVPLIGLAVWSTALPGHSHVSAYFVALLFVQLFTVSYENHTFSGRIYEGELADDLLRPHPVVLPPMAENLALRVWHVIIGLPLLLIVVAVAHPHIATAHIALAVPAIVGAAALRFLFTYVLALSAFWTERAHGAVGFGATAIFLLGGGAAPIPFLPSGVRTWAEGLPFRSMYGFPAEIAAGWLSPGQLALGYGWQAVWIMALVGVATLTWRAGVHRYTAVGG